MKRWRPLWLLVAIGLAVGVNQLTKPRFEYVLDASERSTATGKLELQHQGTKHEFDLATVRVVTGSADRVLGAPLPIRVLWLRNAESDPHAEPDLDLFLDFGGSQPVLDAETRSIAALQQRALPVMPVALGSATRSRLRLPGNMTPWAIVEGSLVIREASSLAATAPSASWRVRGELDLVAREEGKQVRLPGAFSAVVVWY